MREAEERTAAIKKKRDAEQAEMDAAEEKRLRKSYSRLYIETANKRVSDLTVSQTQRVQACTALGYYER